jgi:HEAT repeat protein
MAQKFFSLPVDVVCFLAQISRVRANKRIKGLLKVLQYGTDAQSGVEDGFIRGRAAQTLGLIGDTRAVEPLIQTLNDADRWVRMAAAWALGRLGDARAVGKLLQALDDEDWLVRTEASRALGRIGPDSI